jgi:hypothetical protein
LRYVTVREEQILTVQSEVFWVATSYRIVGDNKASEEHAASIFRIDWIKD